MSRRDPNVHGPRHEFAALRFRFSKDLAVAPHARIPWTNDEGGQNSSVTTVTLEAKDGNTLLTLAEALSLEGALDAADTGALDATHETFGQFAGLLAQPNARKSQSTDHNRSEVAQSVTTVQDEPGGQLITY